MAAASARGKVPSDGLRPLGPSRAPTEAGGQLRSGPSALAHELAGPDTRRHGRVCEVPGVGPQLTCGPRGLPALPLASALAACRRRCADAQRHNPHHPASSLHSSPPSCLPLHTVSPSVCPVRTNRVRSLTTFRARLVAHRFQMDTTRCIESVLIRDRRGRFIVATADPEREAPAMRPDLATGDPVESACPRRFLPSC
jgi:hypothetical protein